MTVWTWSFHTAIVGTSVNIEALKAQIDAWHDEQVKPLPFDTAA